MQQRLLREGANVPMKASFTASSARPLPGRRQILLISVFPGLGEMKARHRPSVPGATRGWAESSATTLCCRDPVSLHNLPANTHGCDALLYPSEITKAQIYGSRPYHGTISQLITFLEAEGRTWWPLAVPTAVQRKAGQITGVLKP